MPSKKATKKQSAKKAKKAKNAVAFHIPMEENATHVVGFGNIRVILFKEPGAWIAQGLEIDYAASGSSKAEAKKNFEIGLEGTIDLHIKVHNTIKNLLKTAPPDIWAILSDSKGTEYRYTQVSFHDDLFKALPYDGLGFYEPLPDGVAA
jgi:hypothetical protein